MRPGNARGAAALFDPARLRIAREAAGLRKVELARRVEVSPAAVSQFEHGASRPSPQTLTRLALTLGFPIEFFAGDGRRCPSADVATAFFRSLRATPLLERQRAAAHAALVATVVAALSARVRLPTLDLPDFSSEFSEGQEAIEDAATELRALWQVPPGPVANVVRLLEAHGVVVARLSRIDPRVDAFSQWHGGRPLVILNGDKEDEARHRHDGAHELGHLVGHADGEGGNRLLERQAHAFAAAFLMPRREILDELPARWDPQVFISLKRTWGVSIQNLLYRARELGRLSESSYRRALISLTRDFSRTVEPAPLRRSEDPVMLSRAAELVWGERAISELAAVTALPEALITDVIGIDATIVVDGSALLGEATPLRRPAERQAATD
ncbi:MAG TPA: XRE family transcriptional regulator [Gaiellaceae bacterium]|nr:XRE family transcriptional regulator [Gaiellaceae bacterium]